MIITCLFFIIIVLTPSQNSGNILSFSIIDTGQWSEVNMLKIEKSIR